MNPHIAYVRQLAGQYYGQAREHIEEVVRLAESGVASPREAPSDEKRLRVALIQARTILANMAKENPPKIAFGFQRWPMHHEPLRSDAKHLLPIVDAALDGTGGETRGKASNDLREQRDELLEALKALNLAFMGIPFQATPKQLDAAKAASDLARAAIARATGKGPKAPQ